MKNLPFKFCLAIGLCLTFLSICTTPSSINSFESADRYLSQHLLPSIELDSQLVSDTAAYNVVIPPLADSVPDPNSFPLYGAKPSNDPNIVYVEIYSSAEKANGERQDERWLIDVVEKFNQQRQRLKFGEVIQVGIRNIPSGLGAQILAARKGKPAGYTPATALWLELLKAEGLPLQAIAPALVSNQAIFAIQPQVYQQLAKGGGVTFDRLMDAILADKIQIGYSNPYIGSSALNFLHTLLWRSAGHAQDGKPLTIAELESSQVNSVFSTFQKQIALTTPTYLDLKQIWIRDPQKFQAIVMAYQSYVNLKKQPEFAQLAYIPFGVPENSPLVGFDWNTASEREALEKFAAFATSTPMQQLAQQQGYEKTEYLQRSQFPPLPSGEVLKAAQSFWKQRKDGGHTVYMELIVDTSGSMEQNNRLQAVQKALRFASQQINRGNQIGLVTFSDRPTRRITLAPFNELEQKRLFAAIDQLRPDGETALYDGLAVGLADLMEKQKTDPKGRFYLLLLTDGERTNGLDFGQIKDVIKHSRVRVYPIAYGKVNQQELEAIAAIREGSVYQGTPEKIQVLLKDLFQTNL
ncbi:vWA domain-containing protein [Nostoc favosum]|uniref:VWA domain-containing protein n=1 Tax=Nostoc favosum CHAB5714 TaxID=2780399 RepID=A0ABS8I5S5_9NOSO|nr:VWA domain-containing protein [Nostoc favosum]MCC5599545.1 VWA domain-containing protein [Nostoc favosum CHAB5714]